jgi:hypothetical protein
LTKLKDILSIILGSFRPKEKSNYNSGKSIEEQFDDLGAFKYTDNGFVVTFDGFSKTLNWADITEINVYKKDLITIDEIRMQIVYGDKQIEISEELPGWFQFTIKTKDIFQTIPKEWDIEIINPAFATNFRTIYSKAKTAN